MTTNDAPQPGERAATPDDLDPEQVLCDHCGEREFEDECEECQAHICMECGGDCPDCGKIVCFSCSGGSVGCTECQGGGRR